MLDPQDSQDLAEPLLLLRCEPVITGIRRTTKVIDEEHMSQLVGNSLPHVNRRHWACHNHLIGDVTAPNHEVRAPVIPIRKFVWTLKT